MRRQGRSSANVPVVADVELDRQRFCHDGFPGIRFDHRFPLDPFCQDHESIWLMEKIETGALHRMMTSPPPADAAGVVWTTWGSPAS